MKEKTLEVIKKEDGAFQMFLDGNLRHPSIPDKWLSSELAKLGFCGQEYRDIRDKLDQFGKATVTFIDSFDMSK